MRSVHAEDNILKCSLCNQGFTSSIDLERHIALHFQCHLCEDKPFLGTFENFQDHNVEKHLGIAIPAFDARKSREENDSGGKKSENPSDESLLECHVCQNCH